MIFNFIVSFCRRKILRGKIESWKEEKLVCWCLVVIGKKERIVRGFGFNWLIGN